jgi:Uma2 family endonuclease
MTVDGFLALDRENLDQKYEYRNGQMVAMAGGSTNHTVIIGNFFAAIHPHLRKKPCVAQVEGTLKIEDQCYLPDIMVTCNEQDRTENKTYIEYPKLVIEVLSPTTEKSDRIDKVWTYMQYPSIQEYLLVNWDVMLVQKMTRKSTEVPDDFQWVYRWYSQDESVELESVGLVIPIEDIYEKAVLPPFEHFRRFKRRRA